MAKVVGKKLVIDGYSYVKSRERKNKVYWDCQKVRARECSARAITLDVTQDPIVVIQGPDKSVHSHPPNQDAVKAMALVEELKTTAQSQPSLPPALLVRDTLSQATPRVLSQLPLRENLRQTVCRERRQNLPSNPKCIADLEQLPDEFTKTTLDEQFVLHDNYGTQDEDEGRVIVFATRKNIEVLCRSEVWFLDGTFKVCPSLFTQVFTIIGTRKRITPCGTGEETPVPLVYALLEGKHEEEYSRVLEVVRDAVQRYRINPCTPMKIMSDFEKAILNACAAIYPAIPRSGCFFHLGQAVYRRVQALGLQARYNDEQDDSIRNYTHMMLSLAYVPSADVPRVFQELRNDSPDELKDLLEYFDTYYVRGIPARGRRRAVQPRFPPNIWNQYDAAVANSHKTNNISEGWHNRFRTLVGKVHPDLYTFITEVKKEQANTEVCLLELSLGRRVKNTPARHWFTLQDRIRVIVMDYDDYVNDGTELEYLRNLGTVIEIN